MFQALEIHKWASPRPPEEYNFRKEAGKEMKYYNTLKNAKVEITPNQGQRQVPRKGNPANCFLENHDGKEEHISK